MRLSYICIIPCFFVFAFLSGTCLGRSRLEIARQHDVNNGPIISPVQDSLIKDARMSIDNESQKDDWRIIEEDEEESISVKNAVVSALDMLGKKNENAASGVVGRQVDSGESLFPTVLMETTIMRSDPPNFFKFLMEDYLEALVNYMLPSTLHFYVPCANMHSYPSNIFCSSY